MGPVVGEMLASHVLDGAPPDPQFAFARFAFQAQRARFEARACGRGDLQHAFARRRLLLRSPEARAQFDAAGEPIISVDTKKN